MPRPRKDHRPPREPARRKLTPLFVARAKPQAERVLIWDADPRQLALAVQPGGKKVFKLIYPFNGRVRWYTIGDAGIGLKEARKIARELLGEVARGRDPQAERRAARAAGTFEELATRYREEYAKKRNRSWAQPDALVRRHLLPAWGKLGVKDISRGDVRRLFARLTEGSPTVANQTLAAASAVFSWAIKNEVADLPANPCHGIQSNPTKDRERVLSDAEVAKFWAGFDEAGLVRSRALRMILLTGQRPGEVRHMHRAHLEVGRHKFTDANGRTIEAEGAWWSMPGAPDEKLGWPGTKSGSSHRTWLPKAAVAIIDELDGDGFVFAGPRGRPITALDQAMSKVCARVGIAKPDKVTPHDLRRTFSTTVTSLGFSRDQLNRQTNHKEGGIASVYDRHGYADENRRIAEAVAARIASLIGRGEGEVVQLRG